VLIERGTNRFKTVFSVQMKMILGGAAAVRGAWK
jgi:hypothetical protein